MGALVARLAELSLSRVLVLVLSIHPMAAEFVVLLLTTVTIIVNACLLLHDAVWQQYCTCMCSTRACARSRYLADAIRNGFGVMRVFPPCVSRHCPPSRGLHAMMGQLKICFTADELAKLSIKTV